MRARVLALTGYIKYEEIEEMDLPMKVEGLISNYLRGEDEAKWGSEHDVVTKAVVEPIMRFDPSYSQPTGGQPKDEYVEALDTWNKMDLGHIYGFPVWEEAVFELLKSNYGEMKSIFASYAMAGNAGSGSAKSATTMDQTELTQFAVDCSLETAEYPVTRIMTVFERADLVCPFVSSAASAVWLIVSSAAAPPPPFAPATSGLLPAPALLPPCSPPCSHALPHHALWLPLTRWTRTPSRAARRAAATARSRSTSSLRRSSSWRLSARSPSLARWWARR